MKKILFPVLAVLLAAATVLTVNSCKKDEDSNDIQNTAPKASFTVTPSSGTTETQFEFDASACSDEEEETSTLEVRWDWENDGSWDTDWSSNKTINHKYNAEGEYTVALEVKDSGGLKDSETHDVSVQGGSGNNPPTAIFSVSPSSGTTSTTFEFDGSDSYDNEDPTSQLQVRWDFDGDGSWDTGWDYDKTKNHQYSAEGTYTAKMEVKDTEGLTDYTTQTVTVDNGGGGNGCDGQTSLTYGGQTYDIVEIGDQCWMAENLNIGTRIDGSEEMEDNGIIEKYCYGDDPANCDEYGGLYQWDEMMQYTIQQGTQGICPDGWHLPTDDEWKILEGNADTQYGVGDPEWDDYSWRGYDAGKRLKSTTGWDQNTGTDAFGFTALPGGYRSSSGSFYYRVDYGWWWSSTEHSGTGAWGRSLYYDYDQVHRLSYSKTDGRSVRCLKN